VFSNFGEGLSREIIGNCLMGELLGMTLIIKYGHHIEGEEEKEKRKQEEKIKEKRKQNAQEKEERKQNAKSVEREKRKQRRNDKKLNNKNRYYILLQYLLWNTLPTFLVLVMPVQVVEMS
jgi:actin-related protein